MSLSWYERAQLLWGPEKFLLGNTSSLRALCFTVYNIIFSSLFDFKKPAYFKEGWAWELINNLLQLLVSEENILITQKSH